MRVIDRLYQYIEQKHIAPYTFERNCGIANGYLKKQTKGRGSIGSEILEKIADKYSDLSLIWLITGKGQMLTDATYTATGNVEDPKREYRTDEPTLRLLNDKISILENGLADKEKIIRLLEKQLERQ